MEDLDGNIRHHDVEIHFIHADYVSPDVGITQLQEFKREYSIIHHSCNYGWWKYLGGKQHSDSGQIRSLFDLYNDINVTKPQPHFTAVRMSMRDHFLGICAEEFKESGLVNAKAAAEDESTCLPEDPFNECGPDLNPTEVNPFLALLVSIYQILLFITRTYCINS